MPRRRGGIELQAGDSSNKPLTDPSKAALGGEDSGASLVRPGRLIQSAPPGFENGFEDMVCVAAVVHLDVQGDPSMLRDGPKEFGNELGVELAHLGGNRRNLVHQVWAIGKIQGHRGARFVHGNNGEAIPPNGLPVAQRLAESISQANADVLHGVMSVDLQIARRVDFEIE